MDTRGSFEQDRLAPFRNFDRLGSPPLSQDRLLIDCEQLWSGEALDDEASTVTCASQTRISRASPFSKTARAFQLERPSAWRATPAGW
jgi:hypothetical protein